MNFFKKSKVKKAQKAYEAKLMQQMNAQRSGDIQGASVLNDEATRLLKELETLKAAQA